MEIDAALDKLYDPKTSTMIHFDGRALFYVQIGR